METPLVSVKMITYNHAPFIAQAIESVLQQKTNFPYELVIGEDCSTDGTREIVFEYEKKYPEIIRVITSEKNVGMNKNSYRTTKACTGKYIAWCEGDDYWQRQDKLQQQVDYMENTPECGLVYSDYDVCHVDTGNIIRNFIKYRNYDIPENINLSDIVLGKAHILTCTAIINRTIYNNIIDADPYLHQSDHFLMGDTQIWADASNITKIHFISESLATHVITEESATRSKKDITKKYRFAMSNSELLIYLCKKYDLPEYIRKKYEVVWYQYSLRYAFYSRNVKLADEIKANIKKLTLKESILYYGTKNILLHMFLKGIVLFSKIFKKNNMIWQ